MHPENQSNAVEAGRFSGRLEGFRLSGRAVLSAYPVTVEEFSGFLNQHGDDNFQAADGSYLLYNVFNPELPISYDDCCYRHDADAARLPVTGVSLMGAMRYAFASGGRLPTVSEWRGLVRRLGIVNRWLSQDSMTGLNMADRMGRIRNIAEAPAGPWSLIGNVSHWCVPDQLKQQDGASLGTVSAGVGGCAWNKAPPDSDEDWLYFRWARTGAVGVGVRCVYNIEDRADAHVQSALS